MRATRNEGGETPTDAYVQPPHPRLHPPPRGEQRKGCGARPRRQVYASLRTQNPRDALACRRSTAALAAANQRRRSAPARASWDAADIRRYLKRACPSSASCSQTGHGAGRACSRSRPGAKVTSLRPREPHSPRPPASPGGRPVGGRDSWQVVSEIGTYVNENVTTRACRPEVPAPATRRVG